MTTNTVCVDDYIAPGATDDTSAFASAFATGMIVTMTARTYTVTGITIPANGTLKGVGPASKIVGPGTSTSPINISSVQHVCLRDFSIAFSGSGATYPLMSASTFWDVQIQNVTMTCASGVTAALSLQSGKDFTNNSTSRVQNCAIVGQGCTNGILINATSSITIDDTSITGAGSWAILVTGSSSSPNENILISGNVMSGSAGGVYLESDLSTAPNPGFINPAAPQTKSARIVGNHIENMVLFGVLAASWELIITSNNIRNLGGGAATSSANGNGIVAEARQLVISNNNIFNVSGQGINSGGAIDMVVSGNMIQQTGVYGISITSGQYTSCIGNVISGAMQTTNTAFAGRGGTATTAGIIISEDPGAKNGGNVWGFSNGAAQPAIICTIAGNVISAAPTPSYQQYGISLSGTGSSELYIAVSGNTLPGAGSVTDIQNNGSGTVLSGNVTTH